MARRVLASLPLFAVVLLWAARADAHATFVGAPSSVAPDTDVALTMNVPHEKGSGPYNVSVAVALPTGWRTVSCQAQATWTCSGGTEGGRAVARFTKDAGAAKAQDETFHLTVHSGTTNGVVSFPTVQTYSTGDVVRWIDPPGSATPAPTLTVAGAAPVATAPPVTIPATTAAPKAVATTPPPTAPPTDPVTTVTEPATTTSTSTTAPATTTTIAPTTTAVAATTAAPTTAPSVGVTAPTSTKSSGGGSTVGVVLAVVAVAAAGGAGLWLYLRRRVAPTTEP